MTEDFLNAIREAFNLQDPTPQLRELIHAHPELPTITDIVIICFELVEQSPSQINKLAGALVNLKSTEFTVATYDRLGKPMQVLIDWALNTELVELLNNELAWASDGSITPSNDYLIASLLSAVAVKFSLCPSKALSYEIDRGLNYQDSYRFRPAIHEVSILGACLQLCMSGAYFCGPEGFDDRHLLSVLEKIKEVGDVKHPDGQRLLEITIQQAKDGFKSYVDSWSILFP